jgi:hypothetical protein
MLNNFFRELCCWIVVMAFGCLLAIGLVEFASGCGESYIDYAGVTHINQCVFIK